MKEPMTHHTPFPRAAGNHPVVLVRLSKAYAYMSRLLPSALLLPWTLDGVLTVTRHTGG